MQPVSSNRWFNRTAFVTGGDSGIGADTVRRLIDMGVNVVSFDKNIDNLEALSADLKNSSTQSKKGKLYPIKGDLRKEEDILTAFDWVDRNVGVIHVLVNNAGIVTSDTILDFDTEQWRELLEVNVLALSVCTREAIKSMKAHGFDEGHIFNINSILGQAVLTYMSPLYTASKFAVRALTEALRKQLSASKSRIRVTSINPGLVNTDLMNMVPKKLSRYALTPSDVVDAIVYALTSRQEMQIAGLTVEPEVVFNGRAVEEAAEKARNNRERVSTVST